MNADKGDLRRLNKTPGLINQIRRPAELLPDLWRSEWTQHVLHLVEDVLRKSVRLPNERRDCAHPSELDRGRNNGSAAAQAARAATRDGSVALNRSQKPFTR